MARVIFTRTYNHRWPSRALTEFRPTGEAITVKKEVADKAVPIYARYAEAMDAGGGAAGSVAGPNPGTDGTLELSDSDELLAGRSGDGVSAGLEG